jgi:hypothetical protein
MMILHTPSWDTHCQNSKTHFDPSMSDLFSNLLCLKVMAPGKLSNASESFVQAFEDQVIGKAVPSKYDRNYPFVPESSISNLVTPSNIKALVPDASQELVKFVCENASKVFLTLWLGFPSLRKDLSVILTSFKEGGFHNGHFPVEDITLDGKCAVHRNQTQTAGETCGHSDPLSVFHRNQPWGISNVMRFYREQAMFSAPIFREESFKTTLIEGCILPFTWRSEKPEWDGYFGTVCEVGLHLDHQDVVSEVRYEP